MITNDFIADLRDKETPVNKKMVKMGSIKQYCVETTPVVWKNKLIRFEWARNGAFYGASNENAYHFIDCETEKEISYFAQNHIFGCCYAENDIMYVCGPSGNDWGGKSLDMLWSTDLENWESKEILSFPDGVQVFNTSLCKGDNEYILAIEIGGNHPMVGVQYTIVFAKSKDLMNWELIEPENHTFSREKYTACPAIRYFDGFYYMVYLEELPYYRCMPYIVRTKDFELFEVGLRNPFMMFDDDDKKILRPENFTKEQIEKLKNASNNNNSDVDFCEFNGKTIITYSWGNQLGKEYLAQAEYNGGLQEFLESYFK